MNDLNPPRTVVFDLGGVLIDWDPRHLYRKIFDDEGEMDRFLAEICNIDWILQLDGGLPMEEGVANLSRKHPEQTAYIEAYWKRWPEMIEGAIDGSVEILKALHQKGVPLYALSNWSVETWPYARDQFAFLERFGGMVISGFEGTKKPEPKIFRLLQDRYGIEPADAVFIDDRADNIAAAETLGFDGILFTQPSSLSVELSRLGLL